MTQACCESYTSFTVTSQAVLVTTIDLSLPDGEKKQYMYYCSHESQEVRAPVL